MLDPEGRVVELERRRAALQGLRRRTRSSASISPASTPKRTGAAALPEQALADRRARGPVRERGLARAQGRHAASGRMSSSTRSATPTGELIGFAKITRDLTERREAAETRCADSEEQFRLLVQGVTDYAIYMLDPEGRVSSWNAGAAAHQGLPRRTRSSASTSRASTRDEDRAAGEPARGAGDGRGARAASRTEGWRVRKDGTRFWAHVVIDPIRDDDGELIGFAKITRDITERAQRAARAGAGARGAVPVAEDGGDRPADRRRRARLQQPADGRRWAASSCCASACRDDPQGTRAARQRRPGRASAAPR